jgi:hypothetical protein
MSTMKRAVAASVPLVLLLGALGAGADHVQQDAVAVSFDHRGGNEWWVEVAVGGPDASRVAQVRAMDTGGAWVQLEKRSWGVWAASFRIEPGHEVRFEAVAGDGSRAQSCWFSHPQGVERCGTAPAPAVTFDHKGGNEWWVQAQVSGSPVRVQAMDTGGAWVELQRKDWGDWAASFRIEPGHDVRFRALVDGAWAESCWFTHPGGRTPTGGETCGAGTAPPPADGFDARFSPRPGNAWWVEVFVEADRPLAGVDARANGGAWVALEKRSWGAWAKSFHVPDGSIVEFRARATDGATDMSGRRGKRGRRSAAP